MAKLNHWYLYFPIFSMPLPGVPLECFDLIAPGTKLTVGRVFLLHIQFLGEVTSFFSLQSYNAAQLGLLRDISF